MNNDRSKDFTGTINPIPTLQMLGASLGRIANLAATAYLLATALSNMADRRASGTDEGAVEPRLPKVVPAHSEVRWSTHPESYRIFTSPESHNSIAGDEPW